MSDDWRQLADRYSLTIEQVKERLPLEWVVAVAAGIHLVENGEGRTQGVCPFHADTNPSLDVYGYGDRWGCFPCGRAGDVFDFIGEYWELQSFGARFEKSLELLQSFGEEDAGWQGLIEKAGPVTPVTVVELSKEVEAAQHVMERQTTKPIKDLLERKRITQIDLDWLKRTWRLGVTMKNEVMAPYWDVEGGLISYKTRVPSRGGWYARKGARLTSLYGEWQMVGAQAEADIWLCEGETDTWLASWLIRGQGVALGLPSGAGATIRDEWIEHMRGKRVTVVMDADISGRNAARRWWEQLHMVAREVTITFPESDLCESKHPLRVLSSGKVVTAVSGFIVARGDGRVYQEVTARGVGAALSNFTLQATKRIQYRDSLGAVAMEGYEGHFADQAGQEVRIRTSDMQSAADMRRWASEYGRSWYGSSPKHPQALQDQLQAQAPFLKEEIAVPVAGLWGYETGHSVFVLPLGSGGSVGSAIGREKWSFAEGLAKYDIGGRYLLQDRDHFDVQVLKSLMKMHERGIMTPIIAWMTAAPLRSLVREFPPLAVLGGSGSGKTSLTLAVMKEFWGWQGSEQNLTNTTPYAAKQASAASNGLPMWFDEYRRGARKDTFTAMGQIIRDSWTGGVSTRGGVGDDLSRIEVTAAIAPLVLSGEAELEERSHQDRVIVVRLGVGGKQPSELLRVMDDVSGSGGGVLGRRLIAWQLRLLDEGDPLVAAGGPARMDRQAQGEAVLEWGWEMWKRFLSEEFGVEVAWDLDLGVVATQRRESQETPEIEALIECLQQREKWRLDDRTPVAWVEDEASDVVCVRQQAFYNAASRMGYVLPGGPGGAMGVLKDQFGVLGYGTRYLSLGDSFQVRAWRLSGVLAYLRERGVEVTARGEWEA